MNHRLSIVSFLLLITSAFYLVSAKSAEAPASADPIKIGMSTALSGPAAALGKGMKSGIEIYFAKINANGGIQGRKLELIALDDKYEPTDAASNMHKLIDQDKVLAVIGNVGTPTAVISIPIANEKKTLLFAPYTGAAILRKTPPDRYVINLRASYIEETAFMIKKLFDAGIKANEIAFFTQNDAYGDAGYQGAIKALKLAGYQDAEALPNAHYERNTLNVEAGLSQLLTETTVAPKAIIIVGAYAPVAKFIKLAKQEYPDTLFFNVSFVGTEALLAALNKEDGNVYVTQVVPLTRTSFPLVKEFLDNFQKYAASTNPSYTALEGYLAAKLLSLALTDAAATNTLNREGIIDAFERMQNVDVGLNVKISFDKDHHQALHEVWLTELKNQKVMPIESLDLKKK